LNINDLRVGAAPAAASSWRTTTYAT
jgi:hypothetical protein